MKATRIYSSLLKLYPQVFREKYAVLINDSFIEGLQEASHPSLYLFRAFCELPFSLLEENIRNLAGFRTLKERWWHLFNVVTLGLIGLGIWACAQSFFLGDSIFHTILLILAALFGLVIFRLTRNGVLALTCCLFTLAGLLLNDTYGAYQGVLVFSNALLLHNILFVMGPVFLIYGYCLKLGLGYMPKKETVWFSPYNQEGLKPSWKSFLSWYGGLFFVAVLMLSTLGLPNIPASFYALINIAEMISEMIIATLLPLLLLLFVYRKVGIRSTSLISIAAYLALSTYLFQLIMGNASSYAWSFGPDPLIGRVMDVLVVSHLHNFFYNPHSSAAYIAMGFLMNILGYGIRPLVELGLAWFAIRYPGFLFRIPRKARTQ